MIESKVRNAFLKQIKVFKWVFLKKTTKMVSSKARAYSCRRFIQMLRVWIEDFDGKHRKDSVNKCGEICAREQVHERKRIMQWLWWEYFGIMNTFEWLFNNAFAIVWIIWLLTKLIVYFTLLYEEKDVTSKKQRIKDWMLKIGSFWSERKLTLNKLPNSMSWNDVKLFSLRLFM